MKLTPLQDRLIAAYQQPAVAQPSEVQTTGGHQRQVDRVELSPQAAAAQKVRSRLVAGRVTVAAVPEAADGARSGPASLRMHQTAAAANAAATGVSAGLRIDTLA